MKKKLARRAIARSHYLQQTRNRTMRRHRTSASRRAWPHVLAIQGILLAHLLSGAPAAAQEVDTTASVAAYISMSLEELLEIEVESSSKIKQRAIEAPNVIQVVTRTQIETFDWRSLNDILYKQAGFGPAQDYDRRVVSARGLFEGWNNNHLLFLIDGIPFNDNLYGTAYTWEITPLISVNNIEIIRGPGSALYGSYATNGVIQINTVSAEDLSGTRVTGWAGNDGYRKLNVLTGLDGATFGVVAGFGYNATRGNEYMSYDGSGRKDSQGNLQQFLVQDQRQSWYAWSKVEGKDAFQGLTVQYHYQDWNFQTGHGWLWFIPDHDEAMRESRHLISAKYAPRLSGPVQPEITARYQQHNIDWNMRYYPDGAFDGWYPSGMWEYLKTDGTDVFARGQLTYFLPRQMNLLGGVEANVFYYDGDDEHFSNVEIDNAVDYWPAVENGRMIKLGPWFDYVDNKPVTNIGIYGQFVSGDALGKRLTATLGLRYDIQFFTYDDLSSPGQPERSKSFSQLSPRAALVFAPEEDLAIKAMWGRAFRAPTPTEMFGAHTFTLASNIEELEPETINTAEIAVDWIVNEHVNWRVNSFWTRFENQIAYSAANQNLSTNVYSADNWGFESEIFFTYGALSGFANYSFARRLDETILDNTIVESDELTWAPAHSANVGLTWSQGRTQFSVQGHYSGEVLRRTSDRGVQTLPLGVGVDLDMDRYRGPSVDPFFTLDAAVRYTLSDRLYLGLTSTNVLDTEYHLVKNLQFPFDYRQPGRHWSIRVGTTL